MQFSAKAMALALGATSLIAISLPAAAASSPETLIKPGNPLVSAGAGYVSPPSIPEHFFLDARTRPVVPAWKPGDSIREIPRQFHGREDLQRNRPAPANAPEADPLIELQRNFVPDYTQDFTTPLINQDGQGFAGVYPPDPSGDVGGGFYVQSINLSAGAGVTIYDVADGGLLAGPFTMGGLGSGGGCAYGIGDGVVVFDQLAQRWLLTEFSSSSNTLCVYLSSGDDPVTTTWTRYTFNTPGFPDYPKYGVWPNAYYVGANEGPAVYALDRSAMLAGNPATLQRKSVPRLNGLGFQMVVPASVNGMDPPDAGAPGIFVRQNDDERNSPGSNDPTKDFIELFTLHADFTSPANTTLTGPIRIDESEFDSRFNITSGFGAIHQPGTSQTLDPLLEVIMFPFHYRRFADHESLVGNHVTQIQSGNIAGIRWFELRRNTGDTDWSMYQEGTFAPTDAGGQISRWMAAIGMDNVGDIAMGYSVARASPAVYPGLRYTGRMASDTLGVMTAPETSLIEGGSSQTNFDRWGDYFQMGTDPVDGCTFWFTGMYEPAGRNWETRIGSFRFDTCTGELTFTATANNLDQSVCAASPTSLTPIDITLTPINGFADPVTLSLESAPVGFAGTFTPNPATPPATSVADITVDNSAPPGANTMILRAASGAIQRDLTLDVSVATLAPPVVALQTPVNGATDVAAQPLFTWIAADQSETYLIEIATDAAFNNIILSQTLMAGVTSFQPTAALPTNTQIFWRVSATNACGDSPAGTVFSFTTQSAPGDCSAGPPVVLFSDDVESGDNGWTHTAAVGTDTWVINTDQAYSPTHAWDAQDPGAISDQLLTSPVVTVPTDLNAPLLRFQNWRDMENSGSSGCYDGGILEASVDGGAFVQVPDSAMITDPYTGPVSGSFSSPIGGQMAWCGSQPYTESLVDISAYAGHDVQFRFRLASDSSVGRPGWDIDDITVQGCSSEPSDRIFANGFEAVRR